MIVKVKDVNGAEALVNVDNILLVVPSKLIGTCVIIMAGGMSTEVRGTIDEMSELLNGKSVLVH